MIEIRDLHHLSSLCSVFGTDSSALSLLAFQNSWGWIRVGASIGCTFGGALLGMYLRTRLPDHHLSEKMADVVRLGMALMGTMAAMLLGLQLDSAKDHFNALSNKLSEASGNIILLDRTLAHYGPEAQPNGPRDRKLVHVVKVGRPCPYRGESHKPERAWECHRGTLRQYPRVRASSPHRGPRSPRKAARKTVQHHRP